MYSVVARPDEPAKRTGSETVDDFSESSATPYRGLSMGGREGKQSGNYRLSTLGPIVLGCHFGMKQGVLIVGIPPSSCAPTCIGLNLYPKRDT